MGPAYTINQTGAATVVPALWRRPGWMRAPLLAVIWAGLLIYGSLLPWDIQFSAAMNATGGAVPAMFRWVTSPAWLPAITETSSLGVPNWVSDVAANLLIYGPLGVLLRLTFSRITGRYWLQILCAILIILSLSWMIEATQSLIPGRYAAIQDVLANTMGGAVGVLLGHRVNSLWRASAFMLLRRTAGPINAVSRRLQSPRFKPWMMFLALFINVGLIVLWYVFSVNQAGTTPVIEKSVHLVPFEQAFNRSYDVAAVLLGRSMIVYCLAGSVWMLTMMRGQTRKALGWVVLTAALTAAAVEGLKLIGPGTGADVTEPLLALIAGGLVLTLGFMLVHACRCACRRVEQVPVSVDRRRNGHDYRFALRPDKAQNRTSPANR